MPQSITMPSQADHRRESIAWSGLHERLLRCARSLVGRGRADLAEELVQETLLRLLSRGEHPASVPYAYARTTLVRLWLDEQRGAARRLRRAARWAVSRVGHAAPDPAGADERRDAVRIAVEGLTPAQRAAVTLRIVEELSYTDIAHAMGCTPDVVRATLHRARTRLRDRLGEPS